MISYQPAILWQKWIDPFGDDSDETKWTDYENDNPDIIVDTAQDEKELQYNKQKKSVKVIASPMGLIPYNEHTASGKIFNFWTGHTNFDITRIITDIIDTTEGVEALDVFTRYRFRIAIGKCFEDSKVMSEVNTNIYKFLESNNI